jgi:hypothetical protein
LRRTNIAALIALGTVAGLATFSQADALQTTRAYKELVLTVVVTPSPAPVGFLPRRPAAPGANAALRPQIARLVADPYAGPARIASSGAAWDVAPGALAPATLIAQVPPVQPSPVPVQFVAKPDPNAAYLRVIPHTSELDVPYGTTVFPCAFEIFTFYTTAHQLTDWGYGTKTQAPPPPTYPVENWPAASYLSWAVPDFAATVHAYNNAGSPGETTWTGKAGQSQQHCVDLTVVVPNSQAAGVYTAAIQYNLIVN